MQYNLCVCVGACYMYGACCMGVWVHSIYLYGACSKGCYIYIAIHCTRFTVGDRISKLQDVEFVYH